VNDLNERLKKLRKTLDMTQQEFADRIGIKRNSLANYETGRNTPIDAIIVSICREFNVNEEWLREGKGEMFIKMTRDEEIATFIGKTLHSEEDSFKKRLISALSALNESDWETLEKLALSLVDKEKEQD
jgi:HTH-type transcriptional regulator/antitoxin PezA